MGGASMLRHDSGPGSPTNIPITVTHQGCTSAYVVKRCNAGNRSRSPGFEGAAQPRWRGSPHRRRPSTSSQRRRTHPRRPASRWPVRRPE
jgi:hypothetical protein